MVMAVMVEFTYGVFLRVNLYREWIAVLTYTSLCFVQFGNRLGSACIYRSLDSDCCNDGRHLGVSLFTCY